MVSILCAPESPRQNHLSIWVYTSRLFGVHVAEVAGLTKLLPNIGGPSAGKRLALESDSTLGHSLRSASMVSCNEDGQV